MGGSSRNGCWLKVCFHFPDASGASKQFILMPLANSAFFSAWDCRLSPNFMHLFNPLFFCRTMWQTQSQCKLKMWPVLWKKAIFLFFLGKVQESLEVVRADILLSLSYCSGNSRTERFICLFQGTNGRARLNHKLPDLESSFWFSALLYRMCQFCYSSIFLWNGRNLVLSGTPSPLTLLSVEAALRFSATDLELLIAAPYSLPCAACPTLRCFHLQDSPCSQLICLFIFLGHWVPFSALGSIVQHL